MESAVKENMAHGVLTNVQVNHLRGKIAKQTKEHVKESSETEEKTVTKTLVKPDFETIISETVNMEGTNVKAVIGARGDRIHKIREVTGVRRVDLNEDGKTFVVIGTVQQVEAARNLMTDIVSGRLEGVGETCVVTQFLTSRSRDIIGPHGRMVKRIQDTTRT